MRAGGIAVNRLLADAAGHTVDRARQAVRDAILLTVADARAAGVLAALAVGDQAAIGLVSFDYVFPQLTPMAPGSRTRQKESGFN